MFHSEIRIRVNQDQGTAKIEQAAVAAFEAVKGTGINIIGGTYTLGHPKSPDVRDLAAFAAIAPTPVDPAPAKPAKVKAK